MIFERTLVCSLSTPDSIYFWMAVVTCGLHAVVRSGVTPTAPCGVAKIRGLWIRYPSAAIHGFPFFEAFSKAIDRPSNSPVRDGPFRGDGRRAAFFNF